MLSSRVPGRHCMGPAAHSRCRRVVWVLLLLLFADGDASRLTEATVNRPSVSLPGGCQASGHISRGVTCVCPGTNGTVPLAVHGDKQGHRRCCEMKLCPPGTSYVLCLEGKPRSGRCQPCDPGFFNPPSNSTHALECMSETMCLGREATGKNDPCYYIASGSTTSSRPTDEYDQRTTAVLTTPEEFITTVYPPEGDHNSQNNTAQIACYAVILFLVIVVMIVTPFYIRQRRRKKKESIELQPQGASDNVGPQQNGAPQPQGLRDSDTSHVTIVAEGFVNRRLPANEEILMELPEKTTLLPSENVGAYLAAGEGPPPPEARSPGRDPPRRDPPRRGPPMPDPPMPDPPMPDPPRRDPRGETSQGETLQGESPQGETPGVRPFVRSEDGGLADLATRPASPPGAVGGKPVPPRDSHESTSDPSDPLSLSGPCDFKTDEELQAEGLLEPSLPSLSPLS